MPVIKKIIAVVSLLALLLFAACVPGTEDKSETARGINEAANWVTEDMWNNGLCVVAYYKLTGKGAGGEDVDIESVSRSLESAMAEAAAHNEFIGALSGDEYASLKQLWAALIAELDTLYNVYYQHRPVAAYDRSYELEPAAFEAALGAFLEEAKAIAAK